MFEGVLSILAIDEIINSISNNVWLQSLVILVSFYIISRVVLFICRKYVLKITAKTKTNIDDLIIRKTIRPISLILFIIGIKLALIPLPITEKASSLFGTILYSIIILLVSVIVIRIFDILIENWGKALARKTKSKMDDSIISLLEKFSKIVIIMLVLMFTLDLWGVKIGPLLASLGIAGLAIAFALQSTLSNIFGGMALILDKTIKIGDIIKLDSGEMGVVHDVGIRSTKIKTWNNELLTVPNGKLVESRIQNFSMPDPSARIDIEFGVEYGSKIEKVKKVVLDTVTNHKDILKDPGVRILFLDMGDFALKFKVMFWVDDLSKKWPTHQDIITAIYNNLNKSKIGIPFPTRTIYTKKK